MSVSITFAHKWKYPDDHAGITVPTVLSNGRRVVTATAKVDTGRSSACSIGITARDWTSRLKTEYLWSWQL